MSPRVAALSEGNATSIRIWRSVALRPHNGQDVSVNVVSWPHRRRLSGVGRVLVITRSEKLSSLSSGP